MYQPNQVQTLENLADLLTETSIFNSTYESYTKNTMVSN